jgi:hypothetical protein
MKMITRTLTALSFASAFAATTTVAQFSTSHLLIPSTVPWTDTGIFVNSGTILSIQASGMVSYWGSRPYAVTEPGGTNWDGTQFFADATLPDTTVVSLIGKIGGTSMAGSGTPVPEGLPGNGEGYVGASYNQRVTTGGELFLGFNDRPCCFYDNSGSFSVTVVLDSPPMAQCHDVTVSAGPNCSADASVDAGSFDPDAGDTLTLRQEPPGPYLLGKTAVTLTVTDNHGASDSCTAAVTVVDTTPPAISEVAVTPDVLWPPNGKMVGVTVNYDAADDCGAVTNTLLVTSNEAPNARGDGPAPDWVIEDDHHVQLRAERSGAGVGRVYAITVISTDNAGNSSTRTVAVTVPKNQK